MGAEAEPKEKEERADEEGRKKVRRKRRGRNRGEGIRGGAGRGGIGGGKGQETKLSSTIGNRRFGTSNKRKYLFRTCSLDDCSIPIAQEAPSKCCNSIKCEFSIFMHSRLPFYHHSNSSLVNFKRNFHFPSKFLSTMLYIIHTM